MSNVSQTSIDAYHSISSEEKFEIESQILGLFRKDFDARMSRADIEDTTEAGPNRHIRINSVCSAVHDMVERWVLIEEGVKLGNRSGKAQKVLRLFNPATDSNKKRTDLEMRLKDAQGTLVMLKEDLASIQVTVGAKKGRKYTQLFTYLSGDSFQKAKAPAIEILEHKIAILVKDLRETMGLMFTPGED